MSWWCDARMCLWEGRIRSMGITHTTSIVCPGRALWTGEPANLEMQIWGQLRSDDSCHSSSVIKSNKREREGTKREEAATSTLLCWRHMLSDDEVGRSVFSSATQRKMCRMEKQKKGCEWPLETVLRCRGFCFLCLDANMLLWKQYGMKGVLLCLWYTLPLCIFFTILAQHR